MHALANTHECHVQRNEPLCSKHLLNITIIINTHYTCNSIYLNTFHTLNIRISKHIMPIIVADQCLLIFSLIDNDGLLLSLPFQL